MERSGARGNGGLVPFIEGCNHHAHQERDARPWYRPQADSPQGQSRAPGAEEKVAQNEEADKVPNLAGEMMKDFKARRVDCAEDVGEDCIKHAAGVLR